MFSPSLKKWISLLGLFAALGMTACSPENHLSAKNTNGSLIQTGISGTCTGNAQGTGWVYKESLDGLSYSATAFQQRVADFVSATLNPAELGTVDGVKSNAGTHISLTAHFQFDSSGNIITSSSMMDMEINDSYAGTTVDGNLIPAYPVTFESAVSGQIDRTNKSFTVVFQDSFGSVTFKGHYNGSQISGEVDFANSSSFDGTAGKSGVLGAFILSSCALSQ